VDSPIPTRAFNLPFSPAVNEFDKGEISQVGAKLIVNSLVCPPVPAVPSTFDMIERSQADKTDDHMHWTGGPSRSQKKKESNSTAQVREKRNRKKSKAKQ